METHGGESDDDDNLDTGDHAALIGSDSRSSRALFTRAAEAINEQPKPLLESAETIERMRPTRSLLGVPSAAEQLLAAPSARNLLERLAGEFDERTS